MKALRNRVNQLSRQAVDRLGVQVGGSGNRAPQLVDCQDQISIHIRIPDDVIYELSHYLDIYFINKLLFLSKSTYEIVLPLLWADIDTRNSVNPDRQIWGLVQALQLKPERALLIKQLVLGMDVAMSESPKLSAITTEVIVHLANQGHLVNLTRFWWFCKKAPGDQLWVSLRENCPSLKDIGIRRGPDDLVIGGDSSLLKFRDLIGFHLTTHGVYRYHHQNQIRTAANGASIPAGLYDMLVKHSPRLRELTFDGSCPERSLWDVWPILESTWPDLQSLSLGMVSCFNKKRPSSAEATVVSNFVARHSKLRELQFTGAAHWASHEMIHVIPSHDNLTHFRGRNVHLKAADSLPCLKSVYLTDLFVDSANYSSILRKFGAITKLGLVVDDHQGKMNDMCRSIFDACPLLIHLDLRFRQPLSNYVEIAAASRNSVHLRSFILAGSSFGALDNMSMFTRGQNVVKANPRLESFELYFGDQFSRAAVSGVSFEKFSIGKFTVIRDIPGGRPKGLLITEIKKGIGMNIAHRYVKEITRELQPLSDYPLVALMSKYADAPGLSAPPRLDKRNSYLGRECER